MFKDFWKQAKISKDGLPKRSKRGSIAISSDFENMHFISFFTVFLKHQTPQKIPKAAQKPPKMATGSLQEALKKMISFWILVNKNGPQNGFKSNPKNHPKMNEANTPKK